MEIIKKVFLIFILFILSILIVIHSIENGLLLAIFSILFIIFFVKKFKIKKFALFLILFSFIIKIIAVLILKTPMAADYQAMYDASLKAVNGDFSFVSDGYFLAYGYQLGNVFYQFIVLKIINNVVILKILNCVYSTVITFLIYKITQKFVKEDTARITSLIYSISLYPIYLNSILGNQQLSLMLFLIGIYILLTKKNSLLNAVVIGILFALGNLERPEGIIYITTLIIYNIITLKKIKPILKNTIPVLVTYILLTQMFSFVLVKTTSNKLGFRNADPYWKFLIGFNYEYNGKNNVEDYDFTIDPNLEKQEIIKRVSDFKKIPGLFYNKIKIQWLYDDIDTSFNAVNSTQFKQSLLKFIIEYIIAINIIVIVFAFIGIIKNKKLHSSTYFFIFNLFIYFAVYLLIEVSARYYYNPQICVIILSSYGIERFISFSELYINNFKNKKIKQS